MRDSFKLRLAALLAVVWCLGVAICISRPDEFLQPALTGMLAIWLIVFGTGWVLAATDNPISSQLNMWWSNEDLRYAAVIVLTLLMFSLPFLGAAILKGGF
jgi:hypothetical protein